MLLLSILDLLYIPDLEFVIFNILAVKIFQQKMCILCLFASWSHWLPIFSVGNGKNYGTRSSIGTYIYCTTNYGASGCHWQCNWGRRGKGECLLQCIQKRFNLTSTCRHLHSFLLWVSCVCIMVGCKETEPNKWIWKRRDHWFPLLWSPLTCLRHRKPKKT